MTVYLIMSWVLGVNIGDHIMVVGKSLIEMGIDLCLIPIKEGGIPQLVRDMGFENRRMRRLVRVRTRMSLAMSWHVGVVSR